ncbi:SdpI family protein [bacterium]|jgi:uncharacterized membrane protein|nr:SdpI family protein [bacterium]MBT4648734.1 SdpI family protein [bacterium]
MKAKHWNYLSWLVILITIFASAYFYDKLPDQVVTHWNAAGEPDGWGSKNFVTFFIPGLLIGMYLLFQWLPKLDPKKANYAKFFNIYKIFQFVIIAFLSFMYFITTLYNIGWKIDIGATISIVVGLMMVIFGSNMKKIKTNWFIGIRTPWTLSSEVVWKKTHEFAAKIFVFGGLLFIIISFLPAEWFMWLLILIILVLLSPAVYSYFIFRDIKEKS